MLRPVVALAALLFCVSASATDAFPVRKRVPSQADAAMRTLLDWQLQLDDTPEAEVLQRLGEPDKRSEMAKNEATGEPMHKLAYRLSRRSELGIVIHRGKVAAVSIVLVPSSDESAPPDN